MKKRAELTPEELENLRQEVASQFESLMNHPEQMKDFIEEALGEGELHAFSMALEMCNRPMSPAEIKSSMLRNTRMTIDILGGNKMICPQRNRSILLDVLIHLVDVEDFSAAKALSDFLLGKPYPVEFTPSKEKLPKKSKASQNGG